MSTGETALSPDDSIKLDRNKKSFSHPYWEGEKERELWLLS